MSQKFSVPPMRVPAEKLVRDIRCATRKHHFKAAVMCRCVGAHDCSRIAGDLGRNIRIAETDRRQECGL